MDCYERRQIPQRILWYLRNQVIDKKVKLYYNTLYIQTLGD